MQFSMLTSAFLLLATRVLADNCNPGLKYCGSTLLAIGDYQSTIDAAIEEVRMIEEDGGRHDLFTCTDDEGSISWETTCEVGCQEGGVGEDDACILL